MLYHLFTSMMDRAGPFRLFQYASFRVPAATLTALALTFWLFPPFIERLRAWQRGATRVREDTPERHQGKHGTPTMGGLFLVLCVAACSLLWCDLSNAFVWASLAVLLGFAAIGFVDDYRKVAKRNSKGLAGRRKLLWQTLVVVAVGVGLWVAERTLPGTWYNTRLAVPFVPIRLFHPDMGVLYWAFAAWVIVGTSNAVNLTDGLDGLAIGPTIVSAATFALLAYLGGAVFIINAPGGSVSFNVAEYLNMPHITQAGELAVVCGSVVGAGLGFLWYNTFPATIFMGDVGSLAIGGLLGTMAVLTKNEVLSALLHGIFLLEALSVITQVASFKLTGRRVFRMAPIHHHFELKGWAEPKIIVRFWLISFVLALVCLMTLKLR